jgi:hypothetical protein
LFSMEIRMDNSKWNRVPFWLLTCGPDSWGCHHIQSTSRSKEQLSLGVPGPDVTGRGSVIYPPEKNLDAKEHQVCQEPSELGRG